MLPIILTFALAIISLAFGFVFAKKRRKTSALLFVLTLILSVSAVFTIFNVNLFGDNCVVTNIWALQAVNVVATTLYSTIIISMVVLTAMCFVIFFANI